jgi:hypothetical protein
MKLHRFLLIAAILIAGTVIPTEEANAQRIYVHVEDRPYYRHGPSYWRDDVRYVWVPGHRAPSGRWIRGRYVVRERRGPVDRLRARHRMHRNILFGR